ncbi:SDR family NAD(P)-dependent oxidoreductase [Bacteroides sp. 51]|uniref:SDR family NAD(P)-dependent oxidoreductase n=1 Tax=Bacteroides sp. 51 TaxID=2302938 RepID=UPI0013D4038C|nr:SDR family oxidoreductase [Bacteroides sp. 51]NDV83194.1 SDR family oxidoreductase [Bacteroides sp. 51]
MNIDFKHKICFVTGAAQGIGRAVVTAFHRAGASVAFCDIDAAGGEELSASLPGTRFYPVDVKKEKALLAVMDDIYKTWGDVDIIVNNVGVSLFSPLVETSIDDFDSILAINLRPVFITSREMAIRRNTPEGKKRFGRIINMSSTRYLQSESGTEGYSASKGGIASLTHALSISLSDYNITVNAISPGWIDTGHYGALRPEDHTQHPSGRVGRVEDIANACLFLASPENDFINGQNIVIDGGMTKKMIYE